MNRKCALCERESWTDGHAQPAMCERHFDLALLAGHVLRSNERVDVKGLERAFALLPAEIQRKVSFGKAEIAGL